jgi:hypothetical protein
MKYLASPLRNKVVARVPGWVEVRAVAYVAGEALGGLGKGGLITIIVVSIIAIVTFVWIFRETGRRD